MENVKLIPYGISNFVQVRKENKYYSDKTQFLEDMELAGIFLFVVRPRRFGKSIFVSMMRAYYDINEKDNFDKLFSGLYVHEHPTKERGQYQVLYLDFSQLDGDSRTVKQNFEEYGCKVLDDFIDCYSKFYTKETIAEVKESKTFSSKLTAICLEARRADYQLYLIIDEYDNFTNTFLNPEGKYVVQNLAHNYFFFNTLFRLFKPNFTRILMIGVKPLMFEDYNISINISFYKTFDTMLGLTEEEVRRMIKYYIDNNLLKAKESEIVEDLCSMFGNYCFTDETSDIPTRLFDTDMVCRYLDKYIKSGKPIKDVVWANVNDYIASIISPSTVGRETQKQIIYKLLSEGSLKVRINKQILADEIFEPKHAISLLYYYGLLTITGKDGASQILEIPNNYAKEAIMALYKKLCND